MNFFTEIDLVTKLYRFTKFVGIPYICDGYGTCIWSSCWDQPFPNVLCSQDFWTSLGISISSSVGWIYMRINVRRSRIENAIFEIKQSRVCTYILPIPSLNILVNVWELCIWPVRRSTIDSYVVLRNKSIGDYKNLSRLCTGTGKSTRVSKICSPRRGLPSRGCCKSLTRGWISLFLYKVVVDYFSPTALNPHNKTPFSPSKYPSKHCLVRKRGQLGLIMTSRHCMIYDVTRYSLKRSCLYRGR